ncbi:MAG TPA: DUF305 domain-containing protein [Ignavibacteriales bacterium]|nr:DUF305 domain-containing protein [Ignavibacteriales bacterium]
MSRLYSSLSWVLFAGLLIAGLILTNAPETYASFSWCLQEETGHMSKDMPADTGMSHRTHNMKGMMGERQDSMHGGMKGMMGQTRDSMMNMQMTGDPDQDFAAMMIQHHKGAIRMSEEEINKGKDQKVISMAEKTIKDQKNEIQDLQKFVKTGQPTTGMKSDTSMQRRKGMQEETGSARQHTMMDRMHKMQMTGNQDKDYVSMMVMHHQHAIDMANAYLDKGKDQDLIKLAKDMIKSNEDQIKDLEDWEMEKAK